MHARHHDEMASAAAPALSDGESAAVNATAYRVWERDNVDGGAALHPPTLLRLTVTTAPVPAASVQPESFSQSFSQHAATRPTPHIKVVLSASRMMNGQQQSTAVDVPASDILTLGQRGSKNKKMQEHEAVRMLVDAFRGTSQVKADAAENGYKGQYDAHSRELEVRLGEWHCRHIKSGEKNLAIACQITFADFPGLAAILDFDGDNRHAKTASMTPAYGLTFEGACTVS